MSDTSFSENPPPLPPIHPEASAPPSIRRRPFPWLLAGTHVMAFLIGFMFAYGLWGEWRTARPAHSIAVMPFSGEWRPEGLMEGRVAGAKEGWLEKSRFFNEVSLPDSIAKDLVARAQPGTVKVIATHEVRERKIPANSPQLVGRELAVDAVLSGKVSPVGELTLQLIAVKSGELLWSNVYPLGVNNGGNPSVVHFNMNADVTTNILEKLTRRSL